MVHRGFFFAVDIFNFAKVATSSLVFYVGETLCIMMYTLVRLRLSRNISTKFRSSLHLTPSNLSKFFLCRCSPRPSCCTCIALVCDPVA